MSESSNISNLLKREDFEFYLTEIEIENQKYLKILFLNLK